VLSKQNGQLVDGTGATVVTGSVDTNGVASGDQARSNARHTALAAATSSTQYIEKWADLAGVTLGAASALAVSGGLMFSNNTTPYAAAKAFNPGVSGRLWSATTVNHVQTSGTRGVGIGTTKNATPVAAHGGAYGIFIEKDGAILSFANGSTAALSGTGTLAAALAGNKTLKVLTYADENYLSVCARSTDNAVEYRAKFQRSTIDAAGLQNLYFESSGTDTTTGSSVDWVGARYGGTISPRNGVEDRGHMAVWTTVNGNNIRVGIPAGYDSSAPCRAVLAFHGYATDETLWGDHSNAKTTADALLDAGYLVCSTAYASVPNTWGNQNGINANRAAYQYLLEHFNVSSVSILATSAGTLDALNSVNGWMRGRAKCMVALSPVTSLTSVFNGPAVTGFASSITTAFGISGGNFSTATAGYRPEDMDNSLYRSLPMMLLTASDDTTVDPAANGRFLAGVAAGISPEVLLVQPTGTHSFTYSTYDPRIVAFFDKYAA
jgi:hypothetical protein